jgi:hypothetical protein
MGAASGTGASVGAGMECDAPTRAPTHVSEENENQKILILKK